MAAQDSCFRTCPWKREIWVESFFLGLIWLPYVVTRSNAQRILEAGTWNPRQPRQVPSPPAGNVQVLLTRTQLALHSPSCSCTQPCFSLTSLSEKHRTLHLQLQPGLWALAQDLWAAFLPKEAWQDPAFLCFSDHPVTFASFERYKKLAPVVPG